MFNASKRGFNEAEKFIRSSNVSKDESPKEKTSGVSGARFSYHAPVIKPQNPFGNVA
jgi:hypothetical protein